MAEPREIYMSRKNGWLPRAVATLVVGGLVVVALLTSVAYVPAGHVGVVTLFGRVTGQVLPEGTHLIFPFKTVNRMAIRTVELKEAASVPSEEGLIITLDTSLLFRLDPQKAAEIYRTVGPGYVDVVVEPTLRSAIRTATAAHNANALYTGAREEVAKQVQKELEDKLGPRGIVIESVLLRDIQLPAMLKQSIESKQQAEQDALRMTFILQKEKQEAERKRIEAQGIADFQRIVAQGISAQLLEWKGIEATEKLATSPNSKVIMIGSPRTGLPLIFEPK
ncbi:MAG: membrane protease subunit, stomatin/prohibitin [Acidobacteria bacterium]|nr:MAG: membrane protease subunit, stomatin/prohibitin [Acidobacteriota bacterium]